MYYNTFNKSTFAFNIYIQLFIFFFCSFKIFFYPLTKEIETKGTTTLFNLKTPEQLKIHCGMEHFKALDNDIEMHVATDWNKFKVNE